MARHDLAAAARLRDAALASHGALKILAGPLNASSRRLLARNANPYAAELESLAGAIGPRGIFVLNLVYEWGCSTAAGPDPRGGAAMLRVLDWPMSGIGGHSVIGRFTGRAGDFYAATWPGFAGVLTGMAPGRFSAAINQPPAPQPSGIAPIDAVTNRLRMMGTRGGWPASHLLRNVFETARDFADAVRRLSDPAIHLAAPALFTVAGTKPGEAVVIEAGEDRRRVAPEYGDGRGRVACANMWLSTDFKGRPRAYAADARESAADNNRRRRALALDALDARTVGFADLPPPLLNPFTLQVVRANAARGDFTVAALDRGPGAAKTAMPEIVAGPTRVNA